MCIPISNEVLRGEQEKIIQYSCEDQSLMITVCHQSARLVIPIDDPRDGFFYPTLELMIDNYIID